PAVSRSSSAGWTRCEAPARVSARARPPPLPSSEPPGSARARGVAGRATSPAEGRVAFMPPDRGRSSHLSSERLLDLLEDRLAAPPGRAAEEHLGLPCSRCRERLRILGALLERMRGDRLSEVPEAFHRRALEVFPGRVAPETRASSIPVWLGLAFDSLAQ